VFCGQVRHIEGGLQQSGGPGAVVVDSGAFDDAVEVGAGQHDVVRVFAGQLGDDVVVASGLRRKHLHEGRGARPGQRRTVGEACTHHGNAVGDRVRQRLTGVVGVVQACGVGDDKSRPVRCVGFVENDDCFGAGLLRVEGLGSEEARAALDQRDVGGPTPIDPGEVGRLAAACGAALRRQVDVDRDHPALDGS
jgi:hypothetical protein